MLAAYATVAGFDYHAYLAFVSIDSIRLGRVRRKRMAATHQVTNVQTHYRWNRDLPPAVEIDPGDTVVFDTPEITRNQITKESTVAVFDSFDFEMFHQLAGPVAIRGAEPGDTL